MGERRNTGSGRSLSLFVFAFLILSSFVVSYNVNEAFADTTIYSESGGASGKQLRESNTMNEDQLFVGEEFTAGSVLIGEEFNKVRIEVIRVNSASGSTIIGLWDGTVAPTDENYKCLVGTFDVSTFDTGAYAFTADITKSGGTCTIEAGDVLGAYYGEGLGSTSDFWSFRHSTVDAFDGTNTRVSYYNHVTPAWTDLTAADLSMVVQLTETLGDCPALSVCLDYDGDGIIDQVVSDPEGDSTVVFTFDDVDFGAMDPADSIPAFFQGFGLNQDAANLVAAIATHAIVVLGIGGVWFFKTRQNLPMFVWAMLLIFAGGLGAAIGYQPLLYFFIEIALVVGGVAALIKSGVIGA